MVRNVCDARTNAVSYAYDFLSRPVSRGEDSFAYNARGEVASASIAGQTESHVYDFIGNSLTSTVTSASSAISSVTNVYAANNLNQYETVRTRVNGSLQTEALSYDANGDLTSGGDFVYSYDALSRLTSAYNIWTSSSISNEYDHLSRRIRKVSPDGNHVYFYDGWNLVLELVHRPDNTTDRIEYFWGPDISGTLQGAGGIGGLLYLKYNGAIYIPFYDAYGNILGYWNATGDVVASYTYDAFGKTLSSTGPLADVFSFRYSTKYFDPETELYYYGYRYYSPELRRWITRDPIEERGGINLYVMCCNAPLFDRDYLGTTKVSLNFSNSIRGTNMGDMNFATINVVVNEAPKDKSFLRVVQLRRSTGDTWRVDHGSLEMPYYYSAHDMEIYKRTLLAECYSKPRICEVDGFGMDPDELLPVHAFVVIENHSPYEFVIGAQEFSIGYFNLELDVEEDDSCYHMVKNHPVWYRNLPEVETLVPGCVRVLPLTFDTRVWRRAPSVSVTNNDMRMRPVLKGVGFFDGRKLVWPYKTKPWVVEGGWASLNGSKRIPLPALGFQGDRDPGSRFSDVDVEVDFDKNDAE